MRDGEGIATEFDEGGVDVVGRTAVRIRFSQDFVTSGPLRLCVRVGAIVEGARRQAAVVRRVAGSRALSKLFPKRQAEAQRGTRYRRTGIHFIPPLRSVRGTRQSEAVIEETSAQP